MSTAASTIRHALGVGVEAIVILGIIAALAFGLALANGHPAGAGSVLAGGGNGSSVWVEQLAGLAPSTGLPYGSQFTAGYSTKTQEPWALARCYPNATTILSGNAYADGSIWGEWFSVYPGGPSPQNFVLGASVSPVWTGGGADCTLELYKLSGKYNGALGFTNQTLLATYSFEAVP